MALYVALAPQAANGEEPNTEKPEPRIGMLVASEFNVGRTKALQLSERLGRTLAKRLRVDVVVRGETRIGGKSIELCWKRRQCVRQVSKSLKVRELLFLNMVHVGDRTKIDIMWADGKTGRAQQRPAITVIESEGESDLKEVLDKATELLPDAELRPVPEPEPEKEPKTEELPKGPMAPNRSDVSSDTGRAQPTDQRRDVGRRITTGVWVAGGVSLAALAVGTGFGIAALRQNTQLVGDGCIDMNVCTDIDGLQTKMNVADTLFTTAAIAGVVAAVLYMRSKHARRPHPVEVSATPTSVQIQARLRF